MIYRIGGVIFYLCLKLMVDKMTNQHPDHKSCFILPFLEYFIKQMHFSEFEFMSMSLFVSGRTLVIVL